MTLRMSRYLYDYEKESLKFLFIQQKLILENAWWQI